MRCGHDFRAEIQFKTGCDWQESYEDGATLPRDDDLAPGDSFDGCASRYCPVCERSFRAAELAAYYDALAECVERGRLSLSRRHTTDRLTPRELRAERIRGGDDHPGHWDGLARFALVWDDQAAVPANGPYLAFVESLDRRIDKKLRAAGWQSGRQAYRENLVVRITDDSTITVALGESSPNGPA